MTELFTVIYGALLGWYLKSDISKEGLNDYLLPKEKTLILGDADYDIIGGKNNGISTASVN